MTTFLYSVTTHRCLSQIRDRKNRARLDEINLRASDAGEVDPGLSPEDRLTLHQAIRELPEDMAQAAVYSLLDGMTHAEIAAILSCSRRHVGDLLARLEQWEPSP